MPELAVVTGPGAPALELYAAQQLCQYIEPLFGNYAHFSTSVSEMANAIFLIGTPKTNPLIGEALGRRGFPAVSEQGMVLRTVKFRNRPTIVIGGGSPRATMWAMYELVERWGVRYLLHGDVLPPMSSCSIPVLDLVTEPALPVRQWRVINELAVGPTSWGMADYRPLIDQLAKLKFNRLLLSIWPSQPFVHFEVNGIGRSSGTLFFGHRFPITDDMVGRHLFGEEEREFWNADMPLTDDYEALLGAGKKLVHELIAYAHQRGMECVLTATLTEFPTEFAPLLTGAQKVHQVGELTVSPEPGTDVHDPALIELASAVLRATVNTYPEVDYLLLDMPEFRQWSGQYERSWQTLDGRHGISDLCSLEDVLSAARRRTGYPGGAARAEQEVKGDIVALYFYDRLLNELKVLNGTLRPDLPLILGTVAEELFPLLGRLLPPGSETLNFVDYTPSRIVARREVLRNVPSRELPSSLIYTLHDDNVGVLPQLATGSLHTLTQDLRQHGWAGFSTRYWLIGDHDPCIAYLSRASWEAGTTPEAVYQDHISRVYGAESMTDMLALFRELEAATIALEGHGLGLSFPVPGMMMKHWSPGPMPADLVEDRAGYQPALEAARRVQQRLTRQESGGKGDAGRARPSAMGQANYWAGRLEFGIGYLNTIEAVRQAATAEAEGRRADALQHAETALATACRSIEAFAGVAQDRSDRGTVAVLNEYVFRPLKAKVAELRESLAAPPGG
jgi:hypothetical protein